MRTNIKLPTYIDELIFNKLGAKHEPNYEKFNKNLNLNSDEVKIYLGTYFPRSYAESYAIFSDLLNNNIIKNTYKKKSEINILDIGSGTGGNLFGLLFALKDNLSQILNINIFTIDGNQKALETLNRIILKIQTQYDNLHINIKSQFLSFSSIDELYEISRNYLEEKYDFIVSSKMINELLEKDNNAYYDFCNYFSNHLSINGFLTLIDVTMKVNLQFLPIVLNKQLNKFTKNNTNFKTIIPTSCNFFENRCKEGCFTNNQFLVSHKAKSNDLSKITYRILTYKSFADKILNTIPLAGLVGKTRTGNKYCCYIANDNDKNINAFKVSNEME